MCAIVTGAFRGNIPSTERVAAVAVMNRLPPGRAARLAGQ